MRLHIRNLIMVVSAGLCGCSTYADTAELSSKDDGTALIVAERNNFGAMSIVLKGVDMERDRFTDARVVMSSNGESLDMRGKKRTYGRQYVAKRIPPGEYAIVGTIKNSMYSTGRRSGSLTHHNCYAEGAKVVTVAPGRAYFLKTVSGRLAISTSVDIEQAETALYQAGVDAGKVEGLPTKSLIAFDAGRDFVDQLMNSASCPEGKSFRVVADQESIDQHQLAAIWRSAGCAGLDCGEPPSAEAARALQPAQVAFNSNNNEEVIRIIDAAITGGAIRLGVDYSTALYLRVLALVRMQHLDIAVNDALTVIDEGALPERSMAHMRLLVASKYVKDGDFAKAHEHFRQVMAVTERPEMMLTIAAIVAASEAGDVDQAISYAASAKTRGDLFGDGGYAVAYKTLLKKESRAGADKVAAAFAASKSISVSEAHSMLQDRARRTTSAN